MTYLVRRREAADTQTEQDPASCMRTVRAVVGQLLADLAIDLISENGERRI